MNDPLRVVARAATALFAAGLALVAAACENPPSVARPGVLLELDGVVVEVAELTPLLDYLRNNGDRPGPSFAAQTVLDRHLLPLRFAQRAFAAQRQELRAKADALRRNVMEAGGADPQLRSKGAILGGEASPGLLARSGMELAQAAWCFDEANLGVVSPVIEVARGFCLISTSDHKPGVERSGDLVNAYQVPFYTHTRPEFEAWWDAHKRTLTGKLTYVHPDYVDALPHWLAPLR